MFVRPDLNLRVLWRLYVRNVLWKDPLDGHSARLVSVLKRDSQKERNIFLGSVCGTTLPAILTFSLLNINRVSFFAAFDFVQVKLTPLVPEDVDYSFRLYTLSNPFEDLTCHVRGTCYVEECCWAALPGTHSTTSPRAGGGPESASSLQDASVAVQSPSALSTQSTDGVIHFGDVPLNETAVKEVALENKTDQLMRFEVANPLPPEARSSLQISPTSGQIAPRGRQEVRIEFSSKEPTSLDKVLIPCRVSRLKPVDPTLPKAAPKQPKAKGKPSSAAGGSDGDRFEEVGGVVYQIESGKETDMPLTISAFSDTRQCELEMKDIEFECTTLFHTRRFVFRLVCHTKLTAEQTPVSCLLTLRPKEISKVHPYPYNNPVVQAYRASRSVWFSQAHESRTARLAVHTDGRGQSQRELAMHVEGQRRSGWTSRTLENGRDLGNARYLLWLYAYKRGPVRAPSVRILHE